MFERFTELARRAIFFARYEASQYGISHIDSEHMLLGLLHENSALRRRLMSPQQLTALIADIERSALRGAKFATSVDIPVSQNVKEAFEFAREEADALSQRDIDLGHLMLGLLRTKGSLAAKLLADHGIGEELIRAFLRQNPDRPEQESPLPIPMVPRSTFLQEPINRLINLIEQAGYYAELHSERFGEQRLKRRPWSRKEAIGHLIDWGTAHHQWFVRALTESNIQVSGYPTDDWVEAQQYSNASWPELLTLWIGLNEHLARILARIPEEKRHSLIRVGVEEPIAIEELVQRYVDHCADLIGQILSRL